ncbi:hypothetical protein F4803DRAFT_535779 [Xylaria telfairii]|nr:hypothetical protein F4803DRAFT_535779 [Xylaria telfairii]
MWSQIMFCQTMSLWTFLLSPSDRKAGAGTPSLINGQWPVTSRSAVHMQGHYKESCIGYNALPSPKTYHSLLSLQIAHFRVSPLPLQ